MRAFLSPWTRRPLAMITGAALSAGLGLRAQADPTVFNFASSSEGWTAAVESGSSVNPFTWSGTAGVGGGGAWYTAGVGSTSIKTLTSPVMTVAGAGPIDVVIQHRYNFERGFEIGNPDAWDGGNLRYRVNGGTWTTVANDAFAAGGYNNAVTDNGVDGLPIDLNANPPTFDPGWWWASTGYSTPQYITSAATFGNFSAGDTVQIALRGGWDLDSATASPNWVIGSIQVDGVVPEPGATALATGLALAAFGWARRHVARHSNRA